MIFSFCRSGKVGRVYKDFNVIVIYIYILNKISDEFYFFRI